MSAAPRLSAPNPLAEPVRPILDRAGLRVRTNSGGAGTWFNFETCPACGHKGYQCGVSEKPDGGRFLHAVKCFHPSDNPWRAEIIRYADFLRHIGVDVPHTLAPAGRSGHSAATVEKRQARLRSTPPAMDYLRGRGLSDAIVARFGLGLGEPYVDKAGLERRDALTYPLTAADGSFTRRFAYYNVPGLTLHPTDGNGWVKGEVATYFGSSVAGKRVALVVEGAKDVWRMAQALDEWGVADVALFTSTHGTGGIPKEWRDPAFWMQYEVVYLGQDCDAAGDRLAEATAQVVTEAAARNSRRVTPFPTAAAKGQPKDWTDWLAAPRLRADFLALLDSSAELGGLDGGSGATAPKGGSRLVAYRPVNIQSAFIDGHLYYTTQAVRIVVEKGEDGNERNAEILQTFVVRSDRTQHLAIASPLPKSAGGRGRPVVRLMPAGVLIDREPATTENSTWEWEGLQAWLKGKGQTPSLAALLAAAEGHLRSVVWLPHPQAYALLVAVIAVTFLQSVFDSVPLLLVVGPPGSGKSQLGRAMHGLCANSTFVGQASAATVARIMDQTRGFMVLDDLEQVASKTGDKSQFSDLVQALKLSYNQATAIKVWTDPKTLKTQTLNFFGVKLINNTSGADEILGSRMLRIHTMKLTPERKAAAGPLPPPPATDAHSVRQGFHRWAFDAAASAARAYARLFSEPTSRAEEIEAPLRVVADLADDPAFTARLDEALRLLQGRQVDDEDPSSILVEVCTRLVREGHLYLSPTHVRLEMHRAVDPTWDRSHTNAIPDWSRADWIGREMRKHMVVDPYERGLRKRVAAGGNALRAYRVSDDFRMIALADGHVPSAAPDAWVFCTYTIKERCGICPYQAHCPLIPGRKHP